MTPTWINQLGNWNPQLLRELRGRLKPRSVIVAIAISLVVQVLLLLAFGQGFLATGYELSSAGLNLFRTLTWLIPPVLFAIGSYSLIGDVAQEERRGTLNFLRFSPRTSQNILLGKILGVPLLPYLSVLLFVPLHVVSAMTAEVVPLGFIVSFYLMLAAGCAFLFSVALLTALLSGARGFLAAATAPGFSAITLFSFAPLFMTWSFVTVWSQFKVMGSQQDATIDLQWYYVPIATNVWFSHLFVLLNIGIMTFAIWQVLRRRFHNPTATILSKRQSYAIMAYLEVFFLGFFLQTPNRVANNVSPVESLFPDSLLNLFFLYGINFFCVLVLIVALTPQRQALLDWLRYDRRGHASLQDLIWAEKSPAPVAIGINLIIINALLVPWILLWPTSGPKLIVCLLLIPFMLSLLIYAVITQQILASKIRNPTTWAAGALATLLFLPPITLGLLSLSPDKVPALWVFFGFPWLLGSTLPALSNLVTAIVMQGIILGVLSWQLNQQLKKLA